MTAPSLPGFFSTLRFKAMVTLMAVLALIGLLQWEFHNRQVMSGTLALEHREALATLERMVLGFQQELENRVACGDGWARCANAEKRIRFT
ncbi:MAG: hypothetical protein HQL51_15700 [Magnetococcales bacterium]|nr:hypothetical protein [Magnetococcales bacterium]